MKHQAGMEIINLWFQQLSPGSFVGRIVAAQILRLVVYSLSATTLVVATPLTVCMLS